MRDIALESLSDPEVAKKYKGNITRDFYGRNKPESVHGSINLSSYTNSTLEICNKSKELFERLANPILLFRRLAIVVSDISRNDKVNYTGNLLESELKSEDKENKRMKAVLRLKRRFGKMQYLSG